MSMMLMSVSECGNQQQVSMSGAKQVLSMVKVQKNSKGNTVEQQNVLDRYALTTDPTKLLWIHIYALDGTILFRNPVRCKVTSSGKRLEPRHAAAGSTLLPDVGYGNFKTDELIGPDGTYGSSSQYEYWFDPQGRYHQKGPNYLLTDYPIDLKNPIDEVTGMYNMHKAAYEYQKQQEAILRQKENK